MRRSSLLCLPLLLPAAKAQTLLHHHEGPTGYVGSVVAGTGDLDGDGHVDYLFGDAFSGDPYLRVHDGPSGAFRYRILPAAGTLRAAIGGVDLDGDGAHEVVAAGERLMVVSGAEGSVLVDVDLGGSARDLCWIDDLDGDGRPDLALALYTSVALHGSADGGLLALLPGAAGDQVELLGDLDGDGTADLAVGTSGTGDLLRAHAVPSGAVLWQEQVVLSVNDPLAAVGDVDGDGVSELLVGEAPVGRARLLSGRDAATWRVLTPPDGAPALFFAEAVSAAGDVDRDGVPDLALRSGEDGLYVHSGVSGERILRWPSASYYGWQLDLVGDADGDGFPELISGNEQGGTFLGSGPGFVDVVSPCPLPLRGYCVGAPNSVGAGARLSGSGSTSAAADDLVIEVRGAPPGSTGLFFRGESRARRPFGEGLLCVAAGREGLVRFPPVGIDGAGNAEQPLDLGPPGSGARLVPGSVWYLQFWYRDPAGGGTGVNLSDAVGLTVCP